jgi:ribonuclease HI
MPQKKYYVVWKGRKKGVFFSWEECSAQVSGFRGAEYKSFGSQEAAKAAFQGKYKDYKGRNVSNLSSVKLAEIGSPIKNSYCVDAACSGNPGRLEYRCVHTSTRKLIFLRGPFEQGTNNIGEFLVLVHALALFKQKNISQPIYSDSDIAMKWAAAKKCKTKLKLSRQNKVLFEIIADAENWLKDNPIENRILKWVTAAWGEIPADFGRK